MPKNILVTGANGFVGACLTHRLLEMQDSVSVIVRQDSNSWRIKDIINDLNVYRADLTDSSAVDNIISKVKPEYIYHLAAYGTFSFQKDCDKMIQTNSLGTLNLLNACRRLGFSGFCDERGSGVKIFNQNEKAHSLEIFN